MELSDKEIEELLNELDEGNALNAPEKLKRDHSLIKKSTEYIEEESFEKKLALAEKSMMASSFLNFRFYVTSGIAACLALALFWYSGMDSSSEHIELQMEEVPAYADSATYDSLKDVYPEVDKIED